MPNVVVVDLPDFYDIADILVVSGEIADYELYLVKPWRAIQESSPAAIHQLGNDQGGTFQDG